MKFVFDGRPSESPFVQSIWHTHSESAGTFMSQAVSTCEMVVMRYQGKTQITLRGPETKAMIADCPADAEFFGIQFKLGVHMPHLPTPSLVDRNADLPEASGKSFWLQGAAWEFPEYENADTFVERLMREGLLAREPVVDAALEGQMSDLSLRSIQRRFLRATGLTYGMVRQIERARQAMALLERGVSILDTVDQAGYSDQPHLTRSLKRLMGQTPAQILRVNLSAYAMASNPTPSPSPNSGRGE